MIRNFGLAEKLFSCKPVFRYFYAICWFFQACHFCAYLKLETNSSKRLIFAINSQQAHTLKHFTLKLPQIQSNSTKAKFPDTFSCSHVGGMCWINKFACASRTNREILNLSVFIFRYSSDSVGFRYLASTPRLHITEYHVHILTVNEGEKKNHTLKICVHYAVYSETKANIGIISISIWFGVAMMMRLCYAKGE